VVTKKGVGGGVESLSVVEEDFSVVFVGGFVVCGAEVLEPCFVVVVDRF